ncbi:formate dehydrogenase subunit delta [Shinella sp. JR1-6]|uniref:formate dehydrogenase subunit delta n=1 Tax=Shinella sp. JR1-6 TaxID=2527671 RepID=UPI00102D4675|nr:formate dehydrogenase subunit delta [Shinella sp. JR1-6]TAA59535.1 formate dehydrogenase [Shinella sp. JR1-6]
MSEGSKIPRMANQIATFFHSQPKSEGPNGVATHINKFWEPRMRRQLFDIVDNHAGEGLDSLVLAAVPMIHRPPPAEIPAAAGANAPTAP